MTVWFGSYLFSKTILPRQLFIFEIHRWDKSFASSKIVVTKWCLNCTDQIKNMPALKQIAGIEKTTEVNESLRPSQITEKKIQKVIEVLLDKIIYSYIRCSWISVL